MAFRGYVSFREGIGWKKTCSFGAKGIFLRVRSVSFRDGTWVFPKIVVPQNGWFIMENPIQMDDLGLP